MLAGFTRRDITPPLGTYMGGFSLRDVSRGCDSIHDPLYVRALFLEHDREAVLIVSFDLLHFSRVEADRFKGALSRRLDLTASQILLNCSNTHAGPAIGQCGYAGYFPLVSADYIRWVERQMIAAALAARDAAEPATMKVGAGRTMLPMTRRLTVTDIATESHPVSERAVCETLPLCMLSRVDGEPICLLLSASCQPSTVNGWSVSADFPGAAVASLAAHLGRDVAMFLQGCGADARPRMLAQPNVDPNIEHRLVWRPGDWEDVAAAGEQLAREAIRVLDSVMQPVAPAVAYSLVMMRWSLEALPKFSELEQLAAHHPLDLRRLWAHRQIERYTRGLGSDGTISVQLQGLRLAPQMLIFGLEGAPCGDIGNLLLEYRQGQHLMPLGNCHGHVCRIPGEADATWRELESAGYFEYDMAAPLAAGYENLLRDHVEHMLDGPLALR